MCGRKCKKTRFEKSWHHSGRRKRLAKDEGELKFDQEDFNK